MMKKTKTHLREGTCKRGERGMQVSHRRFVEADDPACLTCARSCDCAACYELRCAFGNADAPASANHLASKFTAPRSTAIGVRGVSANNREEDQT